VIELGHYVVQFGRRELEFDAVEGMHARPRDAARNQIDYGAGRRARYWVVARHSPVVSTDRGSPACADPKEPLAPLYLDERVRHPKSDRERRPGPNHPPAASACGGGGASSEDSPTLDGATRSTESAGLLRQIGTRSSGAVPGDVPSVRDGFVEVHGYRFYWKSVGDPGPAGTLVALHGGPGATHDYLLCFADLVARGYRVVFYDQLGCGRSELAHEESEYTVDRDVEDLDEFRRALGIERMHLLGSSYGGALAIAYALAHPEPIRTLTVASGLASIPLAVREMDRLCRELPPPFPAYIERHGARGEYQHPEYLAAVGLFYRRHLCRLSPWPAEVTYTLDHANSPKYRVMNGPNEFTITGTIRDWDVADRLGEIRVPTLVTVGRYDEVTPAVAESIHHGIAGSELAVFPQSSHTAFWEERDRYMETLQGFLGRHPGA
jgi:proline iminopeptidase